MGLFMHMYVCVCVCVGMCLFVCMYMWVYVCGCLCTVEERLILGGWVVVQMSGWVGWWVVSCMYRYLLLHNKTHAQWAVINCTPSGETFAKLTHFNLSLIPSNILFKTVSGQSLRR